MDDDSELDEDGQATPFESIAPTIENLQSDDVTDLNEEFGDWGGDELEAAYLKAMSALEASDREMAPDSVLEISSSELRAGAFESQLKGDALADSQTESGFSKDALILPDSNHDGSDLNSQVVSSPLLTTPVVNLAPAEARATPRQIIEACLFVGGGALTSKKISGLIRADFDPDFVDKEINELNRQYAAENRPYEIRLGDGGYRLALREEFERIRHKVYGLGPKEVRLSQEALEVLAVVAYHQPVKQSRVEELGKTGCGPILRQLVRRELLAVERDPSEPREVSYKTTARFLSLFSLRNLDELPRHEQVSYK